MGPGQRPGHRFPPLHNIGEWIVVHVTRSLLVTTSVFGIVFCSSNRKDAACCTHTCESELSTLGNGLRINACQCSWRAAASHVVLTRGPPQGHTILQSQRLHENSHFLPTRIFAGLTGKERCLGHSHAPLSYLREGVRLTFAYRPSALHRLQTVRPCPGPVFFWILPPLPPHTFPRNAL